MTERIEVLVVGAGVVGLAIASTLARAGREVIVIERHPTPGQETSSRNSGVIHSGIYYPANSLKAQLCVSGRNLLYEYCRARGIAHQQCGKLIVAQAAQLEQLRALQARALANGVADLQWLSDREALALEPQVRCTAALFSPSTGIIDVHEFMTCLQADLQAHDGHVVFNTEFVAAQIVDARIKVTIQSADGMSELACDHLLNCAGLHATDLPRHIAGYPTAQLRKHYYAKGNYFACHGGKPFRHLVYPMPNEAGLGVHATLDMDGTTRFGPDVQWIDQIDYAVDATRAAAFYAAVREYWPSLPDGALQPAYAGVRPKLVGPAESAADFAIEGPEAHGIPGLINLLGIESPGLTASLAIGETVSAMLH